ncbi:NAD(P)H-dependent oxidoreductase [Actinomadura sp. WMMB 499]|uniref:NAD(P)H-dependent oxidoreductase n=1 Tax=Actinomadura sp. WMMB 499 TaxID=1219491 RepID=UPI001246B0EC|nr:NAD(P)H-dependent oxidoreductase [Actinomadura sp. WMMB 499]QFG21698.1 NAD(P)H-dependent oxidoreductase [Actinomadura sp. WMMB 499]
MNILWTFAHPEARSFNGVLRDHGVDTLRRQGHQVRESDLYAMGWNPVVGPDDFGHDPRERLVVGEASERALTGGTLSPDIRAEQDKLAWADALVLQFPLWWHGMPAILKGWFDRVFVQGFAFGLPGARRYGDGGLAGRRALVVTTAGARTTGFGPRGIHGDAEQLLFPLLHGTLFYSGMTVLPPLVIGGADRARTAGDAAARLDERLRDLATAAPIPYRPEHGGDYDDDLVLHPHLAPGRAGLSVHRAAEDSAVLRPAG